MVDDDTPETSFTHPYYGRRRFSSHLWDQDDYGRPVTRDTGEIPPMRPVRPSARQLMDDWEYESGWPVRRGVIVALCIPAAVTVIGAVVYWRRRDWLRFVVCGALFGACIYGIYRVNY